jgi:RNA polymerase sigma-70 factor (ECF subfamily)
MGTIADASAVARIFVNTNIAAAAGVVYRVHRATVARWLAAIRSQVFECVCQKLSLKLRSSPSEVASLVRLVRSDIDVSIRRLLAGD